MAFDLKLCFVEAIHCVNNYVEVVKCLALYVYMVSYIN